MDNEIKFLKKDLNQCFKVIKRKLWMIIIVTIIAFLIGLILTPTPDANIYSAKSTVYSSSYGSYKDSIEVSQAIQDYADIVSSNKVCERAALLIGDNFVSAEEIKSMITTIVSEESQVMGIVAKSKTPMTAMKVANAVAESFVIEVRNITGTDAAQILDNANQVNISTNGRLIQMLKRVLFAFIGLIVSTVFISLRALFTTKAHSIENCTLNGELEVLGVIPRYDN